MSNEHEDDGFYLFHSRVPESWNERVSAYYENGASADWQSCKLGIGAYERAAAKCEAEAYTCVSDSISYRLKITHAGEFRDRADTVVIKFAHGLLKHVIYVTECLRDPATIYNSKGEFLFPPCALSKEEIQAFIQFPVDGETLRELHKVAMTLGWAFTGETTGVPFAGKMQIVESILPDLEKVGRMRSKIELFGEPERPLIKLLRRVTPDKETQDEIRTTMIGRWERDRIEIERGLRRMRKGYERLEIDPAPGPERECMTGRIDRISSHISAMMTLAPDRALRGSENLMQAIYGQYSAEAIYFAKNMKGDGDSIRSAEQTLNEKAAPDTGLFRKANAARKKLIQMTDAMAQWSSNEERIAAMDGVLRPLGFMRPAQKNASGRTRRKSVDREMS
jgi:hypothetical protein